MKPYTVLGLYDDSGQSFADHTHAMDAYSAMTAIADASESPETLCIIGAIEGHHTLDTPGCDNSASAYATDLRTPPLVCTECGRDYTSEPLSAGEKCICESEA